MKLHLTGAGIVTLLIAAAVPSIAPVIAPAVADARHDARAQKKAAEAAVKAGKAMKKRQWEKAIAGAEAAVALNPADAGYRTLLGSAYLKGGRFASAEAAYRDVMTLQPENATVALNLALAQVGAGRWAEARATLERHAAAIPAADRGLALALAGDPTGAVDVLTVATRSPEATPKTRQNLALALALAGRWQEARTLVGLDLAPVEADKRIVEWAAFARPASASDQVASLLGIRPVADPGLPVALALAGAVPVAVAATNEAPIDSFMPKANVEAEQQLAAEPPAPAQGPVAAPAPTPAATIARAMIAQQAVSPPLIAAPASYKTAVAARRSTAKAAVGTARAPAKGDWVVQIGAFENAAVAKDGWTRATRRFPALGVHAPGGMNAAVKGASFYRLSVGGFARADAVALCRSYRVRGGLCFVRQQAGDRLAAWARPRGIQLASR